MWILKENMQNLMKHDMHALDQEWISSSRKWIFHLSEEEDGEDGRYRKTFFVVSYSIVH